MGRDMDAALRAYGRRGPSRPTWLVGGVAVMLVAAGSYKAMPWVELRLAQPEEYAVADGKVQNVTLADGTQLTLAGGAEVKVRYTRHYREVKLTHGAIFADVAHDTGRPFRVDTGNARIVDVGTSFEVLSRPESIRVTVATGVVQFSRNGWYSKPIRLAANQAATLDQAGLSQIEDVSLKNVARWRSEWVEYRGVPLRQVVADLQSLSPLPIRIEDESLANKLVGGRIRLTDPVGQLQNLAITHTFRVHQTDDAVILSKN